MKLKEKIKDIINEEKENGRKLGRYNASDLYKILTKQLTAENFFEEEERDKESSWHIFWGLMTEKGLEEVFQDWEKQVKEEIQIDDFVISCKADFVKPDRLIEVKCPFNLPTSIKKHHEPQLEAYFRAFKRPVKIMYINRQDYVVFDYKPNESLWQEIVSKVADLHKKLKEIYENKI